MPPKGVVQYRLLADREWLRQKHLVEGLDHIQIARLVGCSVSGSRASLLNAGIYRPKRRKDFGQRLAHISRARMLVDAATVAGWKGLGDLYGVQRTVVQNHAFALDAFDEVQDAFLTVRPRRPRRPEEPTLYHPKLSSPSWIATAWANSRSLREVTEAAGADLRTLRAWMRHHNLTVAELRRAREQALITEYQSGQLLKPIAVTHGLNPAGVWRVLVKAGVDTSQYKRGGR